MFRTALTLALAAGLASCSMVKETGRSRFAWFPTDYVDQMGAASYDEATGGHPRIESGRDYQMVQRVGRKIARVSGLEYDWEFRLLDAPGVVNAFALPGGKVAVYSGLLAVTRNEDGLAAVVGHEVAHVTAEHGNERMTQRLITAGAMSAASVALDSWGDMNAAERDQWLAVLGVGAQLGVLLPFSRTHESEADEIGLRYLVRAGYDPYEAPRVWDRMAANAGPNRPPEWMSTHPDPASRAARLRELIPRIVAEESRPAR